MHDIYLEHFIEDHKNHFNNSLSDYNIQLNELNTDITYFGFRFWHLFKSKKNILKLNSPSDAKKNDIGMVFQHFNLFETLSVFENLIIDSDEQRENLKEKIDTIMKKYNFSVDLDVPVLNLSAGQKQKVEIIRCLIRSPKVLIMDEPTSVLTEQETSELFLSLKKFSEEGILIIYITHKLKEVMQLCDEVAVMSRGKLVSVSQINN